MTRLGRRQFLRLTSMLAVGGGVSQVQAALGGGAPLATSASAASVAATRQTTSTGTPLPTVRAGQSTFILGLDPAAPQNAPSYQATVLSSGQLYRFNLDKEPMPELVETSEVSEDGMTVRMTLKPNLVYSDGSPIHAEDAVFAMERQRNGPGATFFAPVESAEAPDDRTIVWNLKAPYPDFYSALALHYVLLHPREMIEAEEGYFNNPVSAGPYVVREWIPGTPVMVLEANPEYVGGELMVQEIQLTAVADLTSRVLQVTTGALDWAFDLPASATSSLPEEVEAIVHPLGGIYHVTFNLNKEGPFQDARVRQAMSLAIDREAINQTAFFGISAPIAAYLDPGAPQYEPILPNGGQRDVEAARQLLAETPYANGFEFDFLTWSARAGWKEATLIIAENLGELGINARVEAVEDAVVFDAFRTGNYDAWWTGTVSLPMFILSTLFASDGFYADLAGYNNPEVTALVEAARVELDANRRQELMTEIQRVGYQDMPHIPITERAVLVGTRLEGDAFSLVPRSEYIRVQTID